MSIIAKAMAPCSKCGEKTEITVYKSINTAENPELREKLRAGSMFIWECPHCRQANLAKYETLYHDPEKKVMIWLMPSGDISETQMQAIANHTRAMGGYILRMVGDVGEEIMSGHRGVSEQIAGTPVHFHRLEETGGEKALVFIYPSSGQMMSQ